MSRFPEVVVKKVDKAVSRGLFKSRSEALRKITGQGLMLKNARIFFRV
jgi:metal-responsive CopG/Arc/MetJ family transcriptional regulator